MRANICANHVCMESRMGHTYLHRYIYIHAQVSTRRWEWLVLTCDHYSGASQGSRFICHVKPVDHNLLLSGNVLSNASAIAHVMFAGAEAACKNTSDGIIILSIYT